MKLFYGRTPWSLHKMVNTTFGISISHWDYGLTMDVLLLSLRRRGGERPFEYLPGLWQLLIARERELAKEQDAS